MEVDEIFQSLRKIKSKIDPVKILRVVQVDGYTEYTYLDNVTGERKMYREEEEDANSSNEMGSA